MASRDIIIQDLKVSFRTSHESVQAVRGVSLSFRKNKITAVIGETGCGKSVMAMSLLKLLPANALIEGGVLYGDRDLLTLNKDDLSAIRSKEIALIPQNPGASLNPTHSIDKQIYEAFRAAEGRRDSGRKSYGKLGILSKLNLRDKEEYFPFQLSGGMKQRVLSGIAMVRNPEWIIADEPTKGLDAELRKSVASLLINVAETSNAGLIIITHDLKFAESISDEIVVMYAGKVVESGPTNEFFDTPFHPYSSGLVAAMPERGFKSMPGMSPSMENIPGGCPFHPRCPKKKRVCETDYPEAAADEKGRKVSCCLYESDHA